jgi:hypothetical protein
VLHGTGHGYRGYIIEDESSDAQSEDDLDDNAITYEMSCEISLSLL